ncbi:MAG: haloacid dehalogenase-like hydrolase [Muribaculaceae bacterium]|nr:haloacid dehalogenase-like hydrolase [Muribaculaceae bacterium]
MVERFQGYAKGATFVDLDGTLLTTNSLHVFMRRMPWTLLRRRAVGASIASLWWMTLRASRLMSHRAMKWHLTRIASRHYDESDWEALAEKLAEYANPRVREYVEAPRLKDCAVYIATAAPEEYAIPLSRAMGYDGAVATRLTERESDYTEMRGRKKLEGITELQEKEGLRVESFLTDHYDDMPTASAYPGLTILVNPSKKMSEIFRHSGVTRYL